MRYALIILFILVVRIDVFAADKLLQSTDLTYVGAFRVPAGAGFDYSTGTIAYNPTNNSIFIVGANTPTGSSNNYVAEISIPTQLVNSSDYLQLPVASVVQGFSDITEGNQYKLGANGATTGTTNGVNIGGLLVYGNSLLGSAYSYYDGAYSAIRSHFSTGKTLSTSGDFSGYYKVGATGPAAVPQAGFIAGYMTNIPDAWQSTLGGTVLSGKAGIPIVSRTSHGPAAFVFGPAGLSGTPNDSTPVTAYPLVWYGYESPGGTTHWTLGMWDYYSESNQYTSTGDNITGVAFPSGSKSILFIGRHGSTNCYGPGTTISAQVGNGYGTQSGTAANQCQGGSVDGAQDRCCYEIAGNIYNKGTHSYPYTAYVWAYSADDFALVRTGVKRPYEIIPYAVWSLNFPTTTYQGVERDIVVSGAAYDETSKRLYVVQNGFEGNGMKPIIHAFNINTITDGAISGLCGSSNGLALASAPVSGLCTAGTPSAVTGTGPWSWKCAGSGGGSTANCSATLATQARTVSIKLGSGGKMTGILR